MSENSECKLPFLKCNMFLTFINETLKDENLLYDLGVWTSILSLNRRTFLLSYLSLTTEVLSIQKLE